MRRPSLAWHLSVKRYVHQKLGLRTTSSLLAVGHIEGHNIPEMSEAECIHELCQIEVPENRKGKTNKLASNPRYRGFQPNSKKNPITPPKSVEEVAEIRAQFRTARWQMFDLAKHFKLNSLELRNLLLADGRYCG